MYPEIETVFLLTLPQHTHVNSSIIREIIKQGGDASQFPAKELYGGSEITMVKPVFLFAALQLCCLFSGLQCRNYHYFG